MRSHDEELPLRRIAVARLVAINRIPSEHIDTGKSDSGTGHPSRSSVSPIPRASGNIECPAKRRLVERRPGLVSCGLFDLESLFSPFEVPAAPIIANVTPATCCQKWLQHHFDKQAAELVLDKPLVKQLRSKSEGDLIHRSGGAGLHPLVGVVCRISRSGKRMGVRRW